MTNDQLSDNQKLPGGPDTDTTTNLRLTLTYDMTIYDTTHGHDMTLTLSHDPRLANINDK